MPQQHWIFISPHLDDVALSCGGLVWDLTQKGDRVEVWTLMAGFPPDEDYAAFARQNHELWGRSGREAIHMRRDEDQAACAVLGAQPRHFDWPDVIYRRDPATNKPMVNDNDELFGKPPEAGLVTAIADLLLHEVPQEAHLVLPAGLGDHIDHRAAVMAGKKASRASFCYFDYPYILWCFDQPAFTNGEWVKITRSLTKDSLHAWQEAVLCYTSQLSGLGWRNPQEVKLALNNYLAGGGGRLWKRI